MFTALLGTVHRNVVIKLMLKCIQAAITHHAYLVMRNTQTPCSLHAGSQTLAQNELRTCHKRYTRTPGRQGAALRAAEHASRATYAVHAPTQPLANPIAARWPMLARMIVNARAGVCCAFLRRGSTVMSQPGRVCKATRREEGVESPSCSSCCKLCYARRTATRKLILAMLLCRVGQLT